MSITCPWWWQRKRSPDIATCLLGGKYPPTENHYLGHIPQNACGHSNIIYQESTITLQSCSGKMTAVFLHCIKNILYFTIQKFHKNMSTHCWVPPRASAKVKAKYAFGEKTCQHNDNGVTFVVSAMVQDWVILALKETSFHANPSFCWMGHLHI